MEGLVGVERKVPVDLARRDVVEARHAGLPGGFEHGLGPDDVRPEEQARVEHGQRVVRLGGEVDDRVDVLTTQRLLGHRLVADVALDEDDPVLDVGQAGSVAGVGEDVVDDDMVLWVLFDPVSGEVRPDETGTSRDEKAHSAGNVSPGPEHPPWPWSGRRWTTSPALTEPGPEAVSTTRRPASSMPLARPVSSSATRLTRTCWPSVAQRRRTSSARARRPAASSSRAHRGSRAPRRWSRRTRRSTGCAVPPTSSRQVPPASAGPGQATLIPMPTTTAVRDDPANSGLGQDPGQLGAVEEQVVGPFQHRLDPGHRPAGVRPGQGHRPRTEVHVARRRSRAGGGPRPAGSPPEATPSDGRGGPARRSDGRPPRRVRRQPRGEPDHGRRCWWNRPRRAGGCPTHRPTWQTP